MKYCVYIIIFLLGSLAITTSLANGSVKIHSPHLGSFSCTEHWDGQFTHLGDALGTDCVIQGWYKKGKRSFMRRHASNGHKNTDWFGYGKKVLAPCDCVVEKINVNKITNKPGIMTPGRASSITFKKPDGTMILFAHLADISVSVGDNVAAGDVVAKVGNNGYSRNPHVHIAAWLNGKALQIQFDQKTLKLKSRKNSK